VKHYLLRKHRAPELFKVPVREVQVLEALVRTSVVHPAHSKCGLDLLGNADACPGVGRQVEQGQTLRSRELGYVPEEGVLFGAERSAGGKQHGSGFYPENGKKFGLLRILEKKEMEQFVVLKLTGGQKDRLPPFGPKEEALPMECLIFRRTELTAR
jgi:hypothetical protein